MFPSSSFNLYSGQDLGLQARSAADSLISILRTLAADPKAASTIESAFSDENSVCLKSMDEAIEAIQEGTKLLSAAEGDIRTLTSRVETLMGLTDEAEVVREIASIFRALEPLLVKISPADPTSKICSASRDRTEAYLHGLAEVLHKFAEDLQTPSGVKLVLLDSASILSAATAFLGQLRNQVTEFQNFCHPDKESSTKGIRAMGEIIGSLADMSAVLGNIRAATEIRKGNKITKVIVDQIQEMKDLNIGGDCKSKNLETAADTMDDIANIIEEVGIDKLGEDLGISKTSFNFNFI